MSETSVSLNGVVVIIVNYGTAALTIKAVESVLARKHADRSVEVHVVDNASPGGDADLLRDAYAGREWDGRVTLWCENENHGFGRGNNVVLEALAARDVPPAYVFLLNPDATLENDAIAILAETLDADHGAVAAGAGIALPDGQPVPAAFRFPTMARDALATVNFGPLHRLFPHQRIALAPETPEGPVDWVAGAAVLIRFNSLRAIGFFDPDFFLYYEEVELMHRLATAGGRILYVPRARVVHAEGAATEVRSGDTARKRRPAYVYDSWRQYFLKRHGAVYALATSVLKYPAALLHLLVTTLRGRPPSLPLGFFADHWRFAVRPLLSGKSK